MNKFSITSSSSNEQFIFSKREGEFFAFSVIGDAIEATGKVSTYTDDVGIAGLFSTVAEFNAPWEGAKSWESLEGEFKISLTCNLTGQVTIQVKLAQWKGGSEDWHIVVHLQTELGQLHRVASEARAFFNA